MTDIETIYQPSFSKLSNLGLSQNHFSCNYLKTILSRWPLFNYVGNLWDQIPAINATDCFLSSEHFAPIPQFPPHLNRQWPRTSDTNSQTVVSCPPVIVPDTEIQIILYLLVFLCIINCGYFVVLIVKSGIFSRIKAKRSKNTKDSEINQSNTETATA